MGVWKLNSLWGFIEGEQSRSDHKDGERDESKGEHQVSPERKQVEWHEVSRLARMNDFFLTKVK